MVDRSSARPDEAAGVRQMTSLEQGRQALREAVQAYAREPSERHAIEVERAIAALRDQRASARGHPV